MTIQEQATRVRDYAQRGMNDARLSVSVRAFMRDTFEVAEYVLLGFKEGRLYESEFAGLPPYPAPAVSHPTNLAFAIRTPSGLQHFVPEGISGLRLLGRVVCDAAGGVHQTVVGRGEALDPDCWTRAYEALGGTLPILRGPDGEAIDAAECGL